MVTRRPPDLAHLHVYGCKAYIRINMLPKKQKLEKRTHIGYLIGYNSSNIYRIWNTSRNKIIRTRDIIFDENLCYNPTDIDLSQLINKPFIETDLPKPIQSDPVDIIEINSEEEQELNSYQSEHLSKLKSHNSIESSDQAALPTPEPAPVCTPEPGTQASTPTPNTPSESESDTITLIPFNRPLARAETIQQSNNTKPKSSNESSTNVTPRATEISAILNASNIIPKRVKRSKKQTTRYQAHYAATLAST